MGYLKQASPKHPLNEVVRKEIRIAKGRSLVARYQNRSGLKIVRKDELLPLSQEPEDILITHAMGLSWQERFGNRKKFKALENSSA